MTKTNLHLLAGCTLLFSATFAHGQQVINFATGLDASGHLQTAGGLTDANWQINNGGANQAALTVAPTDADWFGGWQANGPNSSWICLNPNTNNNGLLDATQTFTLTQNQVNNAVFSTFGASLDDTGFVYLNGVAESPQLYYQNAGALTTFSINPADLKVGLNTLEIKVTSTDYNLEGVRLEGTLTVPQAAPEPTELLALLPAVGFLLKRKLGR